MEILAHGCMVIFGFCLLVIVKDFVNDLFNILFGGDDND